MKILRGLSIKRDNWRDILGVELKGDGYKTTVYTIEEENVEAVWVGNNTNEVKILIENNIIISFNGKNTFSYYTDYLKVANYDNDYYEKIYEKEVIEEVVEEVIEEVVEEVAFNIDLLPERLLLITDICIDRVIAIESDDFKYRCFYNEEDDVVFIPKESDVTGRFTFAITNMKDIQRFIKHEFKIEGLSNYRLLRLGKESNINLDKKEFCYSGYNCSEFSGDFTVTKKDMETIASFDDLKCLRKYIKAVDIAFEFIKVEFDGYVFNFMKAINDIPSVATIIYNKKVFVKSELSKRVREPFSFFEI